VAVENFFNIDDPDQGIPRRAGDTVAGDLRAQFHADYGTAPP
jgi:hypothetical protein